VRSVVVDEAPPRPDWWPPDAHQLLQLARERNARVILSGDTRQHGRGSKPPMALLAIEDIPASSRLNCTPSDGKTQRWPAIRVNGRASRSIAKPSEAAAAGKLVESFSGSTRYAIVACGLGEQADKLADEISGWQSKKSSAVVVSQTWAEVHRVNSRVRIR